LGTAIKIGASGDVHNVENNIFIDPLFPVLFWMSTYDNSEVFNRNIVYYSKPVGNFSLYYLLSYLYPNAADYNLFYSSPTDTYLVSRDGGTMSLQAWLAMGYDQHSLTGQDPQFIDPSSDNYTVSSGSPALNLGFHNFQYGPVNQVGRETQQVFLKL